VAVHDSIQDLAVRDLVENKVPFKVLEPKHTVPTTLVASLLCRLGFTLVYLAGASAFLAFVLRGSDPLRPLHGSGFEVFRPDATAPPVEWVGSTEVLNECMEALYLMRAGIPGVAAPRGLLLEGEPGTGKTLLARKIASETNATFIPVIGSQFVETFVGMGARRVRDLFSLARSHRPSILFIDEVDSIGSRRDTLGNHNDVENTLNQVLAEMDGFHREDGVFVIAATNRVQSLDKALVRPGRFDRHVHIPLPDGPAREKLLRHFFGKTGRDVSSLDFDGIVSLTEGFSGADVQKLVREAVVCAHRDREEKEVRWEHADLALEKHFMGVLKTHDDRTPEEVARVAAHEVGHALVVCAFPEHFRLRKVSIRPNHRNIGGYTLFDFSPSADKSTRDFLEKRIAILMGGKAAEHIMYGDHHGASHGASHDLSVANEWAEKMITGFGYSEHHPTFSGSRTLPLSPAMLHDTHAEVQNILDHAFARALRILNGSRPLLQTLVPALLRAVSMNEHEFLALMT
jgi:ATP-dependent metalloprotease FtsH